MSDAKKKIDSASRACDEAHKSWANAANALEIIAWGNPILLAALAGAAGVRLFDFVDRGNWQPIDVLSMGSLALFGLGWSVAMQRHLASQSQ